jgi:hypothetical protein|tara:strand:- start:2284 stop:2505 length:222 start_codon:yes stop_codon:yes gene_type:complete
MTLIKQRTAEWSKRTGRNVSELAEIAGVKKSWMYDITSGRREPRVFKIFHTLIDEGVLTMDDLSVLYNEKEKT